MVDDPDLDSGNRGGLGPLHARQLSPDLDPTQLQHSGSFRQTDPIKGGGYFRCI